MHAWFTMSEIALPCHELPLFALAVISEHHAHFQIASTPKQEDFGQFYCKWPAGHLNWSVGYLNWLAGQYKWSAG